MPAPVLLQTAQIRSGPAATTQALAFPGAVTAGSLKLCYVVLEVAGATTFGVSDNNGGTTYAADVSIAGGARYPGLISSWPNAAAGATTVTATSTTAGRINIIIEEWANVVTASALDKTSQNASTGTTADSGTTASISQGNELVVGLVSASGFPTFSPGAGYTISTVGGTVMSAENKILISGSGGQIATFGISASNPWICAIATYKSSGGAAGTGQNGAQEMQGVGS